MHKRSDATAALPPEIRKVVDQLVRERTPEQPGSPAQPGTVGATTRGVRSEPTPPAAGLRRPASASTSPVSATPAPVERRASTSPDPLARPTVISPLASQAAPAAPAPDAPEPGSPAPEPAAEPAPFDAAAFPTAQPRVDSPSAQATDAPRTPSVDASIADEAPEPARDAGILQRTRRLIGLPRRRAARSDHAAENAPTLGAPIEPAALETPDLDSTTAGEAPTPTPFAAAEPADQSAPAWPLDADIPELDASSQPIDETTSNPFDALAEAPTPAEIATPVEASVPMEAPTPNDASAPVEVSAPTEAPAPVEVTSSDEITASAQSVEAAEDAEPVEAATPPEPIAAAVDVAIDADAYAEPATTPEAPVTSIPEPSAGLESARIAGSIVGQPPIIAELAPSAAPEPASPRANARPINIEAAEPSTAVAAPTVNVEADDAAPDPAPVEASKSAESKSVRPRSGKRGGKRRRGSVAWESARPRTPIEAEEPRPAARASSGASTSSIPDAIARLDAPLHAPRAARTNDEPRFTRQRAVARRSELDVALSALDAFVDTTPSRRS